MAGGHFLHGSATRDTAHLLKCWVRETWLTSLSSRDQTLVDHDRRFGVNQICSCCAVFSGRRRRKGAICPVDVLVWYPSPQRALVESSALIKEHRCILPTSSSLCGEAARLSDQTGQQWPPPPWLVWKESHRMTWIYPSVPSNMGSF